MTVPKDKGGSFKVYCNTDWVPESHFYVLLTKKVPKNRLAIKAGELYYLSVAEMPNVSCFIFNPHSEIY